MDTPAPSQDSENDNSIKNVIKASTFEPVRLANRPMALHKIIYWHCPAQPAQSEAWGPSQKHRLAKSSPISTT
eukprot:1154642-Pelagomonas_calceolata.AAC.2